MWSYHKNRKPEKLPFFQICLNFPPKIFLSADCILMNGNIRKITKQTHFLNFLELLKLKNLLFYCFGASTFGHVTVLLLEFLKFFLYYFKDWDIIKKG